MARKKCGEMDYSRGGDGIAVQMNPVQPRRAVIATERSQFFLRNVALIFDAYHGSDSRIAQSYSRAV